MFLFLNEEVPTGEKGEKAENLAQKILKSIKHDVYLKTRYLEWSFVGKHHYLWDKNLNKVVVKWDRNEIILYPDSIQRSYVVSSEKLLQSERDDLIKTAQSYFNNDSFWLIAPHKILDEGTQRTIVKYNEGEALLVTYTLGGNTPGDSYLWILDEKGMPQSFKMWVSIIPVGGLEVGWNEWKTTQSGIELPKSHSTVLGKIKMGEVKAYN